MSGKPRPARIGRPAWIRRVERDVPELSDAAWLIGSTPTREVIDWPDREANMGMKPGELLRQRDRLIELGYALQFPDGGILHTAPAPTSRKAGRNDASRYASA